MEAEAEGGGAQSGEVTAEETERRGDHGCSVVGGGICSA